MSGSYLYDSCYVEAPLNCMGPEGSLILHGESKIYYLSSSVLYPNSCISQIRSCYDGVLSGSYLYPSCSIYYTYSWVAYSWSSCSVSCGGGIMILDYICQRNDGLTVSDSYCGGTQPYTTTSCNTQSCIIGGGYCTLYTDSFCSYYGCGSSAIPSCPSTWVFWDAGGDGGCSSGTTVWGPAPVTSFLCYS